MSDAFTLRRATVDDATIVARHRAEMFRDMGDLSDADYPALADASAAWLRRAIPSGEYVAFLAAPLDRPGHVVAGAGVHLRDGIPRPARGGSGIELGAQGLIVNVFTERAYRRRGVAELLMRELLAWAAASGITNLVLHASPEGVRCTSASASSRPTRCASPAPCPRPASRRTAGSRDCIRGADPALSRRHGGGPRASAHPPGRM